jgi:hypothetical protein
MRDGRGLGRESPNLFVAGSGTVSTNIERR